MALKVLIVEDIVINRYLLKEILKGLGHDVVDVENGKLAVEALEKNDFNIIFMDIEMPVMNGFEATSYIRNNLMPPKSDIIIVALTAHDPNLFKEDYENTRFDGIMAKPYSGEKIDEVIKKYFN